MKINELTNSKNFLEILLNNIQSVIFIVNKNLEIQEVNNVFLDTFSLTEKDVIGNKCFDLFDCFNKTDNVNCDKCKLLKDANKDKTISKEIILNGNKITKHFLFKAQEVEFKDKEMVLVILDDVTELVRKTKELEKLATIDELTAIYNRRFILEKLTEQMERSRRYKIPLSVLLIDIDNFKSINDNYGHIVGDYVLVESAKAMKISLRKIDYIGRLGGEEFLVILPDISLNNAYICAERIRNTVKSINLDSFNQSLSISGGLIEYNGLDSLESVIDKVDKLLYRAKNSGKDMIKFFN